MVERLLGLAVPAEHRETYLGDVAEEYTRRRAHGVGPATWLMRELCFAVPLWIQHRWDRTDLGRDVFAACCAFLSALLVLEALNRPFVLEALAEWGPGPRGVLALAINLAALSLSGVVAARVAAPEGRRAMLLLLTLAWAYPVFLLGPAALVATLSLSTLAWGIAVVAAVNFGFSLGSRPRIA